MDLLALMLFLRGKWDVLVKLLLSIFLNYTVHIM